MGIVALSRQECCELLKRVSIGRLACSLDDQPHIVPGAFSYEPDCIYLFSTLGQRIKWMRQHPKVCLQANEMAKRSHWPSVIVTGTYLELHGLHRTAEPEHALEQLACFANLALLIGSRGCWRVGPRVVGGRVRQSHRPQANRDQG